MKDHEKRELVSELVGIASIAHGTEQLRDRIAYALSGVFSAIDGVTGRADKAESELARLREQKPVAYVKYKATSGNVGLSWFAIPTQVYYPREGEPLYAAPAPAVAAPAVPDAKTAGIIKRLRDACPAGSGCKCMVNDAASELERLSALLQSATQSDKEV